MTDLLFLCHRIPYPPDKGEKIRAWHMLLHLSRTYRVHLGCFVDDPGDWAHVEAVRRHCADLACFPLDRRRQKFRALARLRPGLPLSVAYYQDAGMQEWVDGKFADGLSLALVYCSSMAQYAMRAGPGRRVLDMVDVDSEKWRDYAERASVPARLVWAREARTLLAFERHAAAVFDRTLFVSQAEAQRFVALAPEAAGRVEWIGNGVDLAYFAPGPFTDPYPPGQPQIAFVGTMDYRPNIDAAVWFAHDVMPRLRARGVGAAFTVVGANPAPAVRRLAQLADVSVTGRVDDVRPYIAHATAVLAPLRIARGIQNKVLEAMAMGAAVVASPQAFLGIEARPGRDLLVADGADAFCDRLGEVLAGRHPGLGAAARRAMQAAYEWPKVLMRLDALFAPAAPLASPSLVADEVGR
jgi:sugar transferase (PEP-CTERM/EpsH1 system associated)